MKHGLSLVIIAGIILVGEALAQSPAPTSSPSETEKVLDQTNVAKKDPNKAELGEQQSTYMLLDNQDRARAAGTKSPFGLQTDLTMGQDRAAAMIKIIQDNEMKKALDKVTSHGNDVMEKNPEIRTPIAILAGAFSLWAGRTIQLFKTSSVKVTSRIEARNQSGDFNVECPLFNGQLKYEQASGINMGVNRSISSFNTSAAVQYNAKSQAVSSQLYQRIVPHLNLSVGATQCTTTNTTEGTARIQYELNF